MTSLLFTPPLSPLHPNPHQEYQIFAEIQKVMMNPKMILFLVFRRHLLNPSRLSSNLRESQLGAPYHQLSLAFSPNSSIQCFKSWNLRQALAQTPGCTCPWRFCMEASKPCNFCHFPWVLYSIQGRYYQARSLQGYLSRIRFRLNQSRVMDQSSSYQYSWQYLHNSSMNRDSNLRHRLRRRSRAVPSPGRRSRHRTNHHPTGMRYRVCTSGHHGTPSRRRIAEYRASSNFHRSGSHAHLLPTGISSNRWSRGWWLRKEHRG